MKPSNPSFDEGVNGFRRSTENSSSGSPDISGGAASFYHADLDKVQRKLSGVHVQMYVRSRFLCVCLFTVLSKPGSLYVFRLFQVQGTPMYISHQIAGVIGTGLFLGLGQLLAITGPLGVFLVFLLVGSVAFASVLSSVPQVALSSYLVAP